LTPPIVPTNQLFQFNNEAKQMRSALPKCNQHKKQEKPQTYTYLLTQLHFISSFKIANTVAHFPRDILRS